MRHGTYSFIIAIGVQAAASTQHNRHPTPPAASLLQGIDNTISPVSSTRFLKGGKGGSRGRGSRGRGSRGGSYGGARGNTYSNGGGGGGSGLSTMWKWILGALGGLVGALSICYAVVCYKDSKRNKAANIEEGKDGNSSEVEEIPTAVVSVEPAAPEATHTTAPFVPGRLEGMLQTNEASTSPEAGLREPLL